MTERNAWAAVRPLLAAAAMAVLSGCAATHVGEDWQCPIAQGSVCASVAAADPAVPETVVPGTHRTQRPAAETPLYRPGTEAPGTGEAGAASKQPCEADCGPLAWLRDLFAGLAGKGGTDGASGPPDETAAAPEADDAPETPDMAPGAASPVAARGTEADSAQVENQPESVAAPMPVGAAPSDGGLRAPEVIGRVWIAPFVDADGIYREGAWVRVVLEPAAWRLR